MNYQSLNLLDSLADWQEATDPVVSPKIGASYLASDRIMLLASLARGFRGPVGVIGDPDRPLVTAWAGEIGAEYNAGSLQLGLSFFQFNTANERIKDPVTLDVLAAGTSRRRGVSMTAALLIGRRLTLQASGTLNDAEVTGIGGAGGRRLRPRDAASTAASEFPRRTAPTGRRGARRLGVFRQGRRGVHLEGRDRRPTSSSGSPALSRPSGSRASRPSRMPWWTSAARSPSERTTSLDVDLLNVFDAKYPEIRASGYINPGAPRSLLVSVRFLRPN